MIIAIERSLTLIDPGYQIHRKVKYFGECKESRIKIQQVSQTTISFMKCFHAALSLSNDIFLSQNLHPCM